MSPSLQVQSARDTSAVIHVTPPHGGDQHKMKQLLVEYKEERAQSQRQQIQGESTTIQDLSPSTQYSVRAVAVYRGEEMHSEWTPFETQASGESPQSKHLALYSLSFWYTSTLITHRAGFGAWWCPICCGMIILHKSCFMFSVFVVWQWRTNATCLIIIVYFSWFV